MNTPRVLGRGGEVRDGADATATPETPGLILIAEDEHLLARSISSDLQELGYRVLGPAPNGRVALELARGRRPDLALLDIRMPEVDGFAAAEVLFEEMGVPVVILSAYSDPPYLSASARTGVFGYLLKPVGLDQLRVNLSIAWSRYRDHVRLTNERDGAVTALEERKLIERGKGVLMKELGVVEDEAMRLLQKLARDSRRKMAEVAQELLDQPQAVVARVKARHGERRA